MKRRLCCAKWPHDCDLASCRAGQRKRIITPSNSYDFCSVRGGASGGVMPSSSNCARRVLASLGLLLTLPGVSAAQQVEQPPSFNAAQISGIKRVGENYTIRNPVKSDGILRIYVLATPYGDITVQGDEMLRMRVNELKALAALEKVSTSESFGKALAEAGLGPIKFAGGL